MLAVLLATALFTVESSAAIAAGAGSVTETVSVAATSATPVSFVRLSGEQVSVSGRAGYLVDGAFQPASTSGTVTFTPLTANMSVTTVQVDGLGHFTAPVIAGATYQVSGFVDSGSPGLSGTFDAVASKSFTGGEVMDLAIPTSRVTVLIRDQTGRPASGASISTAYDTRGPSQRVVESQGNDSSAATSAAGTVVTHIPTGAHLTSSILKLSGGLAVVMRLADVITDETLLIRYDSTTRTVTVPPLTTVTLSMLLGPSVTDAVTMRATVGGGVVGSQTPTGTVQFSYALNGGPAQALAPPVTVDPSGAAVLSLDQGLPAAGPGPYSFVITAVYTPTPASTFTAAASTPLPVDYQGSDPPPCSSSCPHPKTMVVTVPAGSLVISTPYADSAAPTTNAVTITDTRTGDLGWTASAQTTDLAGPTGSTTPVPGGNLSFTGVTPTYLSGNALQAGSVGTDDITVFGTTAKSFAHKNGGQGPGTVNIYGTLGLTATGLTATSTHDGAYAATVTFTIA